MKTLLIVGSWAKEHITLQHLKRYNYNPVFVYMDLKNPALMRHSDGYEIGKLSDVERIVQFAAHNQVDLALITTASPLKHGVSDALEQRGITAFGPSLQAARLENDKAFTRRLMKKYQPDLIPEFAVFREIGPALEYAAARDWQVAVKPVGLTDGLGVKVFGQQLETPADVEDYIGYILREKYSGHDEVIVEEKISGEEFTLQCLVDGQAVIPTPAVQDFKKLLPGERGVNTASMGSYSWGRRGLPFMQRSDYDDAVGCIRGTLDAFTRETGQNARGILYGQFMITADGVKLVEYNFRPGDPEWMNTLFVMDGNLLDGIRAVLNNRENPLKFEPKTTVCKYIVPPEYPFRLNQYLAVDVDPERVTRAGAALYYSCGLDGENRYFVSTERGFAFLAKGETLAEANEQVERAIAGVRGRFHYRPDIGTDELTREKIHNIYKIANIDPEFDVAREDEFAQVHALVANCHPLEIYPRHVYKIMLRYFGETCYVARTRRNLVGWVLGFLTGRDPETYFLWQIGVHPIMQGQGTGQQLLDFAEQDLRRKGCRRVEVTIDPENIPSRKLFENAGYRNISRSVDEVVTVDGQPVVKDHYGPGRHFLVVEKHLTGQTSGN